MAMSAIGSHVLIVLDSLGHYKNEDARRDFHEMPPARHNGGDVRSSSRPGPLAGLSAAAGDWPTDGWGAGNRVRPCSRPAGIVSDRPIPCVVQMK